MAPRAEDRPRASAAGAAIGSIGLIIFAIPLWQLLPRLSAPIVISAATAAWLGVSLLLWELRKNYHRKKRKDVEIEATHARRRQ